MQHAAGALGAPVDAPRGGAESSPRVVVKSEPFSTDPALFFSPFGNYMGHVTGYASGQGSFQVAFEPVGGVMDFQVWTDGPGLDVIIGHLMALKVRAQIASGS